MTQTEKLLSIGTESLAAKPAETPSFLSAYNLGRELWSLLNQKNGFYAFESALHVFPLTSDPAAGMNLEEWNSESLWRDGYGDLAVGLLFFAEDAFQDQFCLSDKGVLRFKAETGQTVLMADSIENWATTMLADHKHETAWPIASKWQSKNGPLPRGKRLMPKIPFFLGGEYELENLWPGDSVEGMRFKADVAMQTRNLADGTKVRLRFCEKPAE